MWNTLEVTTKFRLIKLTVNILFPLLGKKKHDRASLPCTTFMHSSLKDPSQHFNHELCTLTGPLHCLIFTKCDTAHYHQTSPLWSGPLWYGSRGLAQIQLCKTKLCCHVLKSLPPDNPSEEAVLVRSFSNCPLLNINIKNVIGGLSRDVALGVFAVSLHIARSALWIRTDVHS